MVTQIQLGNLFQQGNRTVLTGGSTGLDVENLVNSLVEARRQPAVVLEGKIELNATKTTALSEMRTLMTSFKDAASFLRNPPGVQNASDNIFKYRSSNVSSNTTVAGSTYLSVTAEPGASIAEYDVTVNQLATRNIKTTNTFALADADTQAVGGSGPFTAGILTLGPNQINIELEDGDTLNNVVAKINAVKSLSKVEASIIQVADGQYRLSLKTTETGTDMNYSFPPPTPPSFFSDAIFRLDANDIDGDGDTTDNPTSNQAVAVPVDTTGNTTVSTNGAPTPTLDVDGINSIAGYDFSAGDAAYVPANTNDINGSGPYEEKAFAFSFRTGSDITGTQTIYEQGDENEGFALHIAPDPSNANAPTLFAVAYNTSTWTAGDQFKVLNLGTVSADTDYNITLEFDASANPTAHDASNTFTGYVNGTQVAQATNLQQQTTHTGTIGIGGTIGGTGLPDETTTAADTNYFKGQIGEITLFNRTLTSSEKTELNTYLSQKWEIPPVDLSGTIGFAIEQNAVDAEIELDGTTITRQSNSMDDVIDKLTFNLLQETPVATELEVSIEPDRELAKQGILNFIDSYNAFRLFISRQTETTDAGIPTEDAVLSGNNTLRLAMSRVSAEMSQVIEGITDGDPARLSDLGIKFADFPGDEENPFTRNILTLDEDVLDSAIAADFDAVRKVFEFDYISDNPNLQVFSRTNELDVSEVSLNIDHTNSTYEATYDYNGESVTINLDVETLSAGGYVLTAGSPPSGTPTTDLNLPKYNALDGLTLIYASEDDDVVTLNLTHGIADRIFNTVDGLLEEDNGALAVELSNIEEENERYEREIDRIDTSIEDYRLRLLQQYAALEAAISQANTLLQTLDAEASARASA